MCYVDARGEFVGFRVNRVEEGRLIPLRMPDVKRGTQLYRNSDVEFEKVLRGRTAERRVALRLTVTDVAEGVRIAAVDGDGYESEVSVLAEDLQPPTDAVRAERVWREQLMRLGDTIYAASEVDLSGMGVAWFVPVSRLADARRRLAERHTEARLQAYVRERAVCSDAWECRGVTRVEGVDLSGFPTDYRANVANRLAREFYRIQGIEVRQRAFELEHCEGVELMRTRHCIRYAMGWCAKSPGYSKSGGGSEASVFRE